MHFAKNGTSCTLAIRFSLTPFIMNFIGKKAPHFQAPAVMNGHTILPKFSSQDYIGKQTTLLFFYPKDFTFVCPTELLTIQARLEAFTSRGVAVIGCSTDTEEVHQAWLRTPIAQGGIAGVTYPLVADASKVVATRYGVLGGEWTCDEEGKLDFEGDPVAYRGTFLIDKAGIVRHQSINDLPLGRSIDEWLRLIDAWQHVEAHGEVCPANWRKGKTAMTATPTGVAQYLATSFRQGDKGSSCCGGGGCK